MEVPAPPLPPPPSPDEPAADSTFSFPYERVIEQRLATLIALPVASSLACVVSAWLGLAVFTSVALLLIGRAGTLVIRAIGFLRVARRRDLQILAGDLDQPPIYVPLGDSFPPLTRTLLVTQLLRRPEGDVRLAESQPLTVSRVSLRARDPSAVRHLIGPDAHVVARRLPTPPGGPFRGAPAEGPTFVPLLVSDVEPARLWVPVLVRAVVWTLDVLALGALTVGAWALALAA